MKLLLHSAYYHNMYLDVEFFEVNREVNAAHHCKAEPAVPLLPNRDQPHC
jgi:hypothetical protein